MKQRLTYTAVLAIAGAIAFRQLCYVPYHCNVLKKTLVQRSERALRARDVNVAMAAARSIIADTNELLERCPDDVDLLMIRAANERMTGRFGAAAETYRTALRVQRRPELFYELGSTELDAGHRDAATDAFTNCVRFYPAQIANVTDPEVRAKVVARVFKQQ